MVQFPTRNYSCTSLSGSHFSPVLKLYVHKFRDNLNGVKDADGLSFGNSVYKITFEKRDDKPVFGHKYWFFLQDAVENVPEYVVRWDNFVQYVSYFISFPTPFYPNDLLLALSVIAFNSLACPQCAISSSILR